MKVEFYNVTMPSFVSAVNLTPTGTVRRAEIKAMCSLPSPLAMLRATSVPLILFCNLLLISSFKSTSLEEVISMNV